uniref:NADH-ubiquinone oxidoreductase chain 4L n=1 Tax=Eoscarta assimilis TaxID=2815129 RepID=A0A8F6D6Q3_9HEMI|nr:NADH dehydrogenase subunit 4L [Eoscarta assimilis]
MDLFMIYLFMFFLGLMSLCFNHKHVFMSLLSLEFIVLVLFLLLYFCMINFGYELYFIMIFLVFSVSEGVVGLSILISLIRSHGNDYVNSFNLVLC